MSREKRATTLHFKRLHSRQAVEAFCLGKIGDTEAFVLNDIGLSAVSGRRAGARGLWSRKSRGGWERGGIDMFSLSGSDISGTRGFLRNNSSSANSTAMTGPRE